MMQIVLQSILGVILSIGGVYLMYLYLTTINSSSNIVLLIGSLALLGVAVFLFIRAGKSDKMFISKMPPIKPLEDPDANAPSLESRLQKNSAMLGDWKKTNETKDRLRMLEISAAAESSPES